MAYAPVLLLRFYQRKAEWVGLAERHPDLLEKAKAIENKVMKDASAGWRRVPRRLLQMKGSSVHGRVSHWPICWIVGIEIMERQ